MAGAELLRPLSSSRTKGGARIGGFEQEERRIWRWDEMVGAVAGPRPNRERRPRTIWRGGSRRLGRASSAPLSWPSTCPPSYRAWARQSARHCPICAEPVWASCQAVPTVADLHAARADQVVKVQMRGMGRGCAQSQSSRRPPAGEDHVGRREGPGGSGKGDARPHRFGQDHSVPFGA